MDSSKSNWIAAPILLAASTLVGCGPDSGATSNDDGATEHTSDDTSGDDAPEDDTSGDDTSEDDTSGDDSADSGAVGDPCDDAADCPDDLSCIEGACQSDEQGDPEWANWPMPNPASAGLPNPASYTVNADTVVDNVTTLEWQRAPSAELYNWQGASDYCRELALAGKHDWRLPSLIELFSLVDFTVDNAASIDSQAFPDTPQEKFLVTTPIAISASMVWTVHFGIDGGGTDAAHNTNSTLPVRCVRPAAAPAPVEHYTISTMDTIAGGTVTDNATGLVWQREPAAESFSWDQAQTHCEGLGANWRAPSSKELLTLLDVRQGSPMIDLDAFPNTSGESFWSSTLQPGTNFAKRVSFDSGTVAGELMTNMLEVRCVQ